MDITMTKAHTHVQYKSKLYTICGQLTMCSFSVLCQQMPAGEEQ